MLLDAPSHPALRLDVDVDVAVARRALRDQIARLEAKLAAVGEPLPAPSGHGAPRLLDLAGLERVRDDLVARIAAAQASVAERAAGHAQARARLEAMLADPAAHKWEQVTRDELGEPGCGDWHVRPRMGLLGMLAGWWEVKLSSGCPLAMALDDRARVQGRHARFEMAIAVAMIVIIVGTLLVFLLVYHDLPLRIS